VPTTPLPDEVRALLAEPRPAVIATVRTDGQPVTVATWYLLEGEKILVNLDHSRIRLQHLRADPRVAMTVLDENWYTHVSIVGHVVEIVADDDMAGIDRIATHYTGKPYPNRESARVNVWVEIDRWHSWGAARRE
jgi:PPOX class probable F420-dependent enzyme